jgi:hypothetical protein
MQRRTLLGLGVAGAAALAVAGGGAALLTARAWRNNRLLPAGRSVMSGVARGVLDGSWPAAAAQASAALQAHLQRLQGTIAGMPPATQGELNELLMILATPPGRRALAGLSAPWDEATVAQLHAAMQSMRQSSLMLRRQAYHALRDLTHAAFFADASTWPLLRYPGPRALA